MSEALYKLGGLRFWSGQEIQLREMFRDRVVATVASTLIGMNPAWSIDQVEGPCLSPRDQVSSSYTDDDIFVTNHSAGGAPLVLRAETTPSSYAYLRFLRSRNRIKYPACVWQAAKSFRRETNDGASAAKLRFNEFYQLEFQCVYAVGTHADYRTALIEAVKREIGRFTGLTMRVVDSDRLPSYSESTLDIEVEETAGVWREVASCSIRTDFDVHHRVCEIAIGLDRVTELAGRL